MALPAFKHNMSAIQSSTLTFKSAVCIVPPKTIWKSIQNIREMHDRHFKRWPPHINLLYPFLPYTEFSEVAIPRLTKALSTVSPFRIQLAQFRWFRHSKNSFTLWLKPITIPEDILGHLETILVELFPDLSGQMRADRERFTPHLSVGQFRSQDQVESMISEMNQTFGPLEFEVNSIQMIIRIGYHDPFRVVHDIPLGGER